MLKQVIKRHLNKSHSKPYLESKNMCGEAKLQGFHAAKFLKGSLTPKEVFSRTLTTALKRQVVVP